MEKARTVWACDMESEDAHSSLVHVKLPSGDLWGSIESGQPSSAARGSRRAASSKAKAQAKSSGRTTGKTLNPLVYAATLRAKSTKLCMDVEKSLEKACKAADHKLNEVAPELCGGEVTADGTLDLLRSRRELVLV